MRSLVFTIVTAAVSMWGCGSSSPTGPSGQESPADFLPFSESFYVIEFHGDSFQCGDAKSPQAGTVVASRVLLRREGSAWAAANGDGTLTLRMERTVGAPAVAGIRLTGTARGFADDEGAIFDPRFSIPPNGTRLAIADAVALSGAIPAGALTDFSQGTIDGPVTFSRAGVTSTCPARAVMWTMNRLR